MFILDSLVISSIASACLLLILQGLEEMSSHKSYFLWMEHARMEREATMLWQVADLERELESARCESLDRATDLLAVERVTATEWGLEAAKVC